MKVHHLQHVSFEGLGCMGPLFDEHGYERSATHFYRGEKPPGTLDFDLLVVMGGPMGVADEAAYPWLRVEKQFILRAIEAGKRVLGICLGAQLVAEVLGARVYRNPYREIGWFPVVRNDRATQTAVGQAIPEELCALHWHSDTFDIPVGAAPLGASAACRNQGFVYNERVLALQFHLEATPATAAELVAECVNDIDGSIYTQSRYDLLCDTGRFHAINAVMRDVVCALLK